MAVVKSDVHQLVTDAIVKKLEAGVSPWAPSWAQAKISRPLRSCGLPYNGVNVLILWLQAMELGYSSPYWLTYKQAEALGAQVRKGEKSTRVVYYSTFEKSETSASGEESSKRIPFLKSYCVFNACQIDGLPEHFHPKAENLAINPGERIAAVDEWATATGARILEQGGKAFYNRLADTVNVPPFAQFESPDAFASVLAHELVHWSGAAGRLDRTKGKRFGDHAYAMEELVAELGAAFILADLGVCAVPRADHAEYLACWLSVLKADKRAIFTASSMASAAAGFLGSSKGSEVAEENELEPV